MAPNKAPTGGGGGGNVPLVTWMLGLDASAAMEGMKGFEGESREGMDRFTERAKTMFPGTTFDVISKQAKSTFADMARDAAAAGFAAEKAFEKAEKAAEKMKRKAEAASTLKTIGGVGLGGAFLYGRSLINQGMATSGTGAVAGFYQEQLARQVAGLWAPITNENTQRVAELTHWFQKLTGAQQESIRMMAMFASTTTGLLYVLPRASSALATFMGASAGTAKAFGVAGAVASVGIGMMASTPEGREALTDVAKAFEPALKGLMDVVREFRPAIAMFSEVVKRLAEHKTSDEQGFSTNPVIGAGQGAGFAARQWVRARLGLSPERNPLESQTNVLGLLGMGGSAASANRSETSPRANGFEMPVDTWERLNAAAQNIELAQKTADNTGQLVELFRQGLELIRGGGTPNQVTALFRLAGIVD